jgi:5-hydroxyisourate hydrolase
MSPLTTHVLDTARGTPAAGVAVTLEIADGDGFSVVTRGVTDADGRVRDLLPEGGLRAATYRIGFALDPYYAAQGTQGFYPYAQIVFRVTAPAQHHHVPLLLSPFGYSTYRGS